MKTERKLFPEPVFVTPHAIDRFQERIAPLDAEEVIDIVQFQLHAFAQRVVEPHRPSDLTYRGKYLGRWFYMRLEKGEGEWPAVVSIMDATGAAHGNLCKRKARIQRQVISVAVREAGKV